MKNCDIHIRDPFVFCDGEKYYLYGTRAGDFGIKTGGFDVYTGTDLENWEGPSEVFDSAVAGYNSACNWAPEVHKYKGKFYMFATFEQKNGNRGTYSLIADRPEGPFKPHSAGALTPEEWFSLDGTLYIDKNEKPWLLFCHEHVQILDGTVCAMPLNEDISAAAGEPVTLFYGSEAWGRTEKAGDGRYVTDGPFMFNGKNGRLYMIWSTCYYGYKQCIAVSDNGMPDGKWTQLPHIFEDDGGHGMLFTDLEGRLRLTLHTPNNQPDERPAFFFAEDTGETITAKR